MKRRLSHVDGRGRARMVDVGPKAVTARLDAKLPGVRVRVETRVEAKTGVEMEALTACAVALLAVYDMAKAADRGMVIGDVRLVEKSGGRSGAWKRRGA